MSGISSNTIFGCFSCKITTSKWINQLASLLMSDVIMCTSVFNLQNGAIFTLFLIKNKGGCYQVNYNLVLLTHVYNLVIIDKLFKSHTSSWINTSKGLIYFTNYYFYPYQVICWYKLISYPNSK